MGMNGKVTQNHNKTHHKRCEMARKIHKETVSAEFGILRNPLVSDDDGQLFDRI